MNVLPFVIPMLLILALMTYVRLDLFFSHTIVQKEFEVVMQKEETRWINDRAKALYDAPYKHIPEEKAEKPSTEEEEKQNPRNFSKMSILILIDQDMRGKNAELWEQTTKLFKKLIHFLYQDHPEYQELRNERPEVLQELIEAIQSAADDLPENEKIHQIDDLGRLDLLDENLNKLWYAILRGTIKKDALEIEEEPSTLFLLPTFLPSRGHFPLTDFINKRVTGKLNVYLAPAQILMVLYDNPAVVQDILDKRTALYKEVKKIDKKDKPAIEEAKKKASEEFQSRFNDRNLTPFDDTILEFQVTTTDPRKYQ